MSLKFYNDIDKSQEFIEEIIKKFGYATEHNFYWYRDYIDKDEKGVFVTDDNGEGLLTMASDDEARVFSSPVASANKRADLLIEYINKFFEDEKIKKIWLELETPLRLEFLHKLGNKFKCNPINYSLIWPIFNLKTFDISLPGKHFKFLRKERNKFYQNHKVEIFNAKEFKDKDSLRLIIKTWKKERKVHDRAYDIEYINIINDNFNGTKTARVFVVDGTAVGINAGWMIPNSEIFYGAIGIHNYSLPYLGQMLFLEDIIFLKNNNFGLVNMGGGEKQLTKFKDEFLPESYYKTHVFSVVRK
jgi:DNA-dependent RNA polymerase auxiliary subunit epsilon